ncbi:unnamed protein product [Prunus armeniaca]|uniref:Uncharacterized protein n=1 Tax=Prunus armeniaca TaxID=36596 RepID=A0A6J5TKP8_PRUAR|nr:unnamed protein product [Prunus armeniaca]
MYITLAPFVRNYYPYDFLKHVEKQKQSHDVIIVDMHLFLLRNNKPWYQRAREMGMGSLWRSINNNNSKSTQVPAANSTLWKTLVNAKSSPGANPNNFPAPNSNSNSNSNNVRHKLRKCTSLKVATAELPPRRSNSYPRMGSYSKPLGTTTTSSASIAQARLSTDHPGIRRVFRGKSLTDDVLMRRFVVEEEAMMQVRRRNQMEVIRRRSVMRRKRLGPSPLCRMVLAEED